MRFIYLILCSFYFVNMLCKDNNTDRYLQYCSHPDCSLKNQHTMCVAFNKQSPRLYASGMTNWMRYQILLLHNRHRDNIAMGLEAGQPPATNMRKMYWDYELEEMAELWARQCQKRHDECRNTIRRATPSEDLTNTSTRVTGENILRRTRYMTTATFPKFKDFATTVRVKTKESPLHRGILEMTNVRKANDEPKIVAFTFCNYGPAGNIDGYPIYEAGLSCSNCPQGTRCGDRTHRALCSIIGDPDLRN
ncbi:venom allergen 5 [Bombyx mori]|uniref:SCP domain-containing protein n=1 Tax=Bombyx mori TaxID=7091 RepID=A0A8R2QW60_BOMMO|nr:venom allergen 5 [Bombyx mori]